MKKRYLFLLLILGIYACSNSSKDQKVSSTDVHDIKEANVGGNDPYLDSLTAWIFEHPKDTKALNLRAEAYIEKKNLKYALADAQTALALDSLSPTNWNTWGKVNMIFNKTRISRDSWVKCIQIDPQSMDCRINLARLYTTVGEYELSEKVLMDAKAINPQEPRIYLIQATNLLSLQQDTVNAIRMAQKAIDVDPEFWEAIDMVAVLYAGKKDPLAVSYYQRLLQIDSTRSDIYYKLGFYYMQTEQWNEAIEAYLKSSELNTNDPEPLFSLGYVHMQLGDYRNAINYFSGAISIREINHRAYYGRGYAYQKLGDVTKAEADYRKALEYNPQHKPSQQAYKELLDYKNQ